MCRYTVSRWNLRAVNIILQHRVFIYSLCSLCASRVSHIFFYLRRNNIYWNCFVDLKHFPSTKVESEREPKNEKEIFLKCGAEWKKRWPPDGTWYSLVSSSLLLLNCQKKSWGTNQMIFSDSIMRSFFSIEFIRLNELWLFQLFDFVCIFSLLFI